MTSEIIPAVLGRDFAEIKRKILELEVATEWFHLDVADGLFVPDTTWQAPSDLEQVGGRAKFEIHLMIEKPEEALRKWFAVAGRTIVHYEATEHLAEIIKAADGWSTEFGLALLLTTPLE